MVLLFWIFAIGQIWNSCPYNQVNCPGLCSGFSDSDSDGICDLSQLPPSERISSQKEMTAEGAPVVTADSVVMPEVNNSTENSGSTAIPVISMGLSLDGDTLVDTVASNVRGQNRATGSNLFVKRYKFIPIVLIMAFIYLVSLFSVRKKIISKPTHIKFWNTALFISFLASFILGLILIIAVNTGQIPPLRHKILYWHVEIATVMSVIAFFHLSWHWTYIKNALRKLR